MANMQRHQSCSFPQQTQQQQHSRYPAAHNTSSAFSSSANPNEDWTKISDLAERRRIQNRIAQRNYRKKLKRRLEDLERKASSPSVSPEPSHTELARPVKQERSQSSPDNRSMARKTSEASISYSYEQQGSPEIFVFDELFSAANSQSMPQFAVSPQPSYAMPLLTPPTDYFPNNMQLGSYPSDEFGLSDPGYQQDYMHSFPQTLPTMVGGALKQESFFGEEDFLSPFSMQYATLAGVEMSTSHSAASYGSRTPSPPASQSYSDSGENSPPYFVLPMTPISRSVSPKVQFIDPRWQ